MKKMRLKGKRKFKKNKFKSFFLIIIILFIIIFSLIKYISMKVNPILLEYASLESRKLASIIINNAVLKNVTQSTEINDLFLISKDDTGEIKSIDFNPIVVNKILTQTTNSVQLNLKYVEEGKIDELDLADNALLEYNVDKLKKGIIYEIPSGVVFNSSFLNNIGPKIPVKFNLIGDIVSHINTKVTDYGINNALVEVNIVLELAEQIILPFISNKIVIETSIPVAVRLIQGTVPKYYLNGMDQNSTSIALPSD